MELFVGKLVSVVALLSLAEAGFSPKSSFSAKVAPVSVQFHAARNIITIKTFHFQAFTGGSKIILNLKCP